MIHRLQIYQICSILLILMINQFASAFDVTLEGMKQLQWEKQAPGVWAAVIGDHEENDIP